MMIEGKYLPGIAVLDYETTGLHPEGGHSPHGASMAFMIGENLVFKKWDCKPFPGAKIDVDALLYNGETEDSINAEGRMSNRDMTKEIVTMIIMNGIHTLAGQNVGFDVKFLADNTKRHGITYTVEYRSMDMHSVAASVLLHNGRKIPTKEDGTNHLNQDTIAMLVGIPPEQRPHKNSGALWSFEALCRLIYGKNVTGQFDNYPVPEWLQIPTINNIPDRLLDKLGSR